jgi:hypothetical protein
MNERTEILIRELSEKLGTTAEHLWGVLIQQAYITATIDMIFMAAWIFAVVRGFLFVRSKTTAAKPTEEERYPRAEWEGDDQAIAWAVWVVTAVVAAIIIGSSLSESISALVNPEYWALKQFIK